MRGAFPPVDFLAVCLVRAIFSHLRDKRRSSSGHRALAARRPSSPQQMAAAAAAAASSPSPNDSGCAEPRPPPGGGARGGATSRSTGGREPRVGTCESPPGSRQDGGGGTQPPGRPALPGCFTDSTVGCLRPPSQKPRSLQPPAEPRTHPKPKSEALAGTDAPL